MWCRDLGGRRLDCLCERHPALHVRQDHLQISVPSSPCAPVDPVHLLVFDLSLIQGDNVKAVGDLILAVLLKVGHDAQRSSAIKEI